jgi:long-chain acyl-CoA synthetase
MTSPLHLMRNLWRREIEAPVVSLPVLAPTVESPPWAGAMRAAGIPATLNYCSTTLSRILDQTADRYGSCTALIYGNARWTYRQLLADVNAIARGLSKLGVRQHDRVALALPNCPDFVAAFFAIQKLGAVVVNLGPLMGADDLERAFSITTPQVAIGLDLRAPVMAQASKHSHSLQYWVSSSLESYQGSLNRIGYRVKRWYGGNGFSHQISSLTLAQVMTEGGPRPTRVEPDMDDVAVLQPTGGTTEGLKLAQLSHRNLLSNAMQVGAFTSTQPGQTSILAVLPMFHVYGLTTSLITGVFTGAKLILQTRFEAGRVLQAVREHRPTIFPLVPAICDALCDEIEKEGAEDKPLEGVKLCLSGAAPLPRQTAERFKRITGAEAVEGYGLTEAAPVTHANPPGHNHIGTIGIPMPDTLARIVKMDEGDVDVAPGDPGELLISGPQIMVGYFGDSELNRGVLTTDASGRTWLHTGDIATMDEDGYFRIVDRKKDMIIRSGMKVYPSRVERVLKEHAAVKEVAVFGRADEVHTEQVVAAIVLKADVARSRALVAELRSLCTAHLAPYEMPEEFEFLETLPRTALGKLRKYRLRDSSPELDPDFPDEPEEGKAA